MKEFHAWENPFGLTWIISICDRGRLDLAIRGRIGPYISKRKLKRCHHTSSCRSNAVWSLQDWLKGRSDMFNVSDNGVSLTNAWLPASITNIRATQLMISDNMNEAQVDPTHRSSGTLVETAPKADRNIRNGRNKATNTLHTPCL
jgi:hypothetical protein